MTNDTDPLTLQIAGLLRDHGGDQMTRRDSAVVQSQFGTFTVTADIWNRTTGTYMIEVADREGDMVWSREVDAAGRRRAFEEGMVWAVDELMDLFPAPVDSPGSRRPASDLAAGVEACKVCGGTGFGYVCHPFDHFISLGDVNTMKVCSVHRDPDTGGQIVLLRNVECPELHPPEANDERP